VTEFTSPGIQTYTIGTSGTYDIAADGAQGGSADFTSGSGGKPLAPGGVGAAVSGDVYLAERSSRSSSAARGKAVLISLALTTALAVAAAVAVS